MKEFFDSQIEIINHLKEEVKKLKDSNLKLEQRVKKLEEKSPLSSSLNSPSITYSNHTNNNNNLVVHSFDNFSTRLANNNTNNNEHNKSELFKLKQAQEEDKSKQIDHINLVCFIYFV
jgi:polyhydroxyalkanoate synthesis regulator protein